MEQQQIESEANELVTQCKTWSIVDTESYASAGNLWATAKQLREKISETFDPIIAKAWSAHKEAVAQKKRHDEPLAAAQTQIKQKMIAYDAEQERLRRAEQLRLELEAKQKAEQDNLDLAAIMEKAGLKEEAEQVISEPVRIEPVVLPKATPKIEGFKYRSNWTFKIKDESKIPREYMTPDVTKIGKIVRALKEATNIPGIETIEEKV